MSVENNLTICLNFYGVTTEVFCDDLALNDHLKRDFPWFLAVSLHVPAMVALKVARLTDRPKQLPDVPAVFRQDRCTVFKDGQFRWIDYYNGQALMFWNTKAESGTLWCDDASLRHELTYLFILSRVGEILDRRGVHRVHALGFGVDGQGCLCVLPSGCGKTTLGMSVRDLPGVSLLSDDTPLVTADGALLAFPTRFGTVSEPKDINPAHIRKFSRREHGDKWVIDLEAMSGKFVAEAPARLIVIGERRLSSRPRIVDATYSQVFRALFESVVVGVGLPQLIEYFLRFEFGDWVVKMQIVWSRIRVVFALMRRCQWKLFVMGSDMPENIAVFRSFVAEQRIEFDANERTSSPLVTASEIG